MSIYSLCLQNFEIYHIHINEAIKMPFFAYWQLHSHPLFAHLKKFEYLEILKTQRVSLKLNLIFHQSVSLSLMFESIVKQLTGERIKCTNIPEFISALNKALKSDQVVYYFSNSRKQFTRCKCIVTLSISCFYFPQ